MATAARVVLGAVFVWSAVAKLADQRWPGAAAAFGVPRVLALAVAPVELLLGAALLTGLAAPAPAWGAAGLLVAYTALVGRALAGEGDAPPCACFGGVTARAVSTRTVARNLALLALAVFAAAAG